MPTLSNLLPTAERLFKKPLSLLYTAMLILNTASAQNQLGSTGNAGIGTTVPNHLLEVFSSSNTTSQFKLSRDNTGAMGFLSYGTDNVQISFDAVYQNHQWISHHNTAAWIVKHESKFKLMGSSGNTPGTGGTVQREMFAIDLSTGYVGIGTINPASRFEVSTNNGEQSSLAIHQVNPQDEGNPVYQPTTKLLYNWYGSPKASVNFHRGGSSLDGFISFSTAGNGVPEERMRINPWGQVSIGTPDSYGYKLAVAGNVIAERIKVKLQTAWPDYVFEPEFALSPLNELAAYIREHRRLPGIPSATELAQQHLDLGDMQQKQMQKIEELTLYVIDLQKQIAAQNKKLEEMEKQLKAK